MNKLSKILTLTLAAALAGCSTTPNASAWNDCFDARDRMTSFDVVSSNEVVVKYLSRQYKVTVVEQCDLNKAQRIAFSNGPERFIGYHRTQGPVYATQFTGTTMVCGRGGDTLVWRDRFDDFRFPGTSCRITNVQRVR